MTSSKELQNGSTWDKLPSKEKREKERFLSGEQRASKGFMTQANTQMELLYNMSEAEPVARCLCDPSLAKRTAAALGSAYWLIKYFVGHRVMYTYMYMYMY